MNEFEEPLPVLALLLRAKLSAACTLRRSSRWGTGSFYSRCLSVLSLSSPWIPSPGKLALKLVKLDVGWQPGWQGPLSAVDCCLRGEGEAMHQL